MSELKITKRIVTHDAYVECPNCNELNGGWCLDPRGQNDVCDYCGNEYEIEVDADIEWG